VNSREEAQKEMMEVLKWANQEEDRIYAKLKAEGRLQKGLDANSEDFKPVGQEVKRRIAELQKKYKE